MSSSDEALEKITTALILIVGGFVVASIAIAVLTELGKLAFQMIVDNPLSIISIGVIVLLFVAFVRKVLIELFSS